jgi:hypothetical protein
MKLLKTSSESEKAKKEHKARSKTTSWNQGDGSIGIKANESVELGLLRASRT